MKSVRSILDNNSLIELVRTLQESLDEKREKLISELSSDIDLVIESREKIMERPEFYIDTACENIENNRGECYFAKDSDEAFEFIDMVLGNSKRIIVSLSEEVRDIGLVEKLRERGLDVYYSCIYHFLADIAGIKHPSIFNFRSLKEEDILKGLGKLFGKSFTDLKSAEKSVVESLKEFLSKTDVGVTGADALAADTGSIFMIDYTGDVRLVTGTPKTHIAIIGIDKIYPTYIEAWTATYLQYKFSTIFDPSGISIISGPSKTGDIEKVTTYGAHGPEKLIVILLDNGRRNFFIERDFKTLNRCLNCTLCPVSLPITRSLIDNLIRPYSGLKEIVLSTNKLEEEEKSLLAYILSHYVRNLGQEYSCPFEVDIDNVLKKIELWVDEIPDDVKESLDELIKKIKKGKQYVR